MNAASTLLQERENERHAKEVGGERGRERRILLEICIGMLFFVTVRHPLLSALPHSDGLSGGGGGVIIGQRGEEEKRA